LGQSQPAEDARDVLLHRTDGEHERFGDRRVRPPLRHQPEHLQLSRRQALERPPRPATREQLRDDLGVEGGAAPGDAAHRVDEVVDVDDPVLEQIADAAAALGEQLGRVRVLDVLRDDEDRHLRNALAQLERGAQSLVAECRREPDVDDRDVGPLAPRGVDQCVAVGDRVDDVEAVVAQESAQPVAQEREVFGDQDAHGSSA
jgi:hypothetical protein